MNEEQKYNSGAVTPYRATANLNTAIANPSVNINDTMNINIQNMATNTAIPDNTQYAMPNTTIQNNINSMNINNQNQIQSNNLNNQNDGASYVPIQQNVQAEDSATPTSNINNSNNQPPVYVTKTYVTSENKPKKKKSILNLGSEFKVALLIIVILLVFVFMLPIVSEMVFGY